MTTKKKTTAVKTAPAKKVAKKAPAKTAKKVAAKKAPAKKTAPKGKVLVCAKGPDCFWVNGGPILKDLVELESALKDMSDKMFTYHVRKHGNDFADWVEAILKDVDTAAALRKAKKPNTAHKIVVKQLKLYSVPKQ